MPLYRRNNRTFVIADLGNGVRLCETLHRGESWWLLSKTNRDVETLDLQTSVFLCSDSVWRTPREIDKQGFIPHWPNVIELLDAFKALKEEDQR